MIGALVIAIIVGVIFRQTYTNVTAEPNVLDNFSVALWDFDMVSPDFLQLIGENLSSSNLIIRAKSDGEMKYSFKNNKQYIEVIEVYKGDELNAGDQIAVTSHSWLFFFDEMRANVGFVNVMQPGHEYLIFLDQQLETLETEKDTIYLLQESIISPIFNYEDQGNDKIISIDDPYDRYVPYEEVKDNEFFVSSEEALEALMELKHELLEQYSK